MGYCKNCGAYIPDGHTKCLACGLDQTEYEESAAYGTRKLGDKCFFIDLGD